MAGHPPGWRQAGLSIPSLVRRLGAVASGGGLVAAMFVSLQRCLSEPIFAFMSTLLLSVTIAPWLIPAADRHRR